MYKWKPLLAVVIAGCMLACLACGKKPLQLVGGCEKEQVFSTKNGKLVLTYSFNQPVKRASVVVGGTFIVSTDSIESVNGTISFLDDQTVVFESKQPIAEILPPQGGTIKVVLVGRSRFQEWIADMDGNPLDGDCDGSSGGSFVSEYSYK